MVHQLESMFQIAMSPNTGSGLPANGILVLIHGKPVKKNISGHLGGSSDFLNLSKEHIMIF